MLLLDLHASCSDLAQWAAGCDSFNYVSPTNQHYCRCSWHAGLVYGSDSCSVPSTSPPAPASCSGKGAPRASGWWLAANRLGLQPPAAVAMAPALPPRWPELVTAQLRVLAEPSSAASSGQPARPHQLMLNRRCSGQQVEAMFCTRAMVGLLSCMMPARQWQTLQAPVEPCSPSQPCWLLSEQGLKNAVWSGGWLGLMAAWSCLAQL